MANSLRLESLIADCEQVTNDVKVAEGGSRYLSLVATHLELARFYAQQRIKENLTDARS